MECEGALEGDGDVPVKMTLVGDGVRTEEEFGTARALSGFPIDVEDVVASKAYVLSRSFAKSAYIAQKDCSRRDFECNSFTQSAKTSAFSIWSNFATICVERASNFSTVSLFRRPTNSECNLLVVP